MSIFFVFRPDGQKKAYVRLAPDYDALDVANKVRYVGFRVLKRSNREKWPHKKESCQLSTRLEKIGIIRRLSSLQIVFWEIQEFWVKWWEMQDSVNLC